MFFTLKTVFGGKQNKTMVLLWHHGKPPLL